MMETLDLNIENYDLNDLLNLFHLDYNFNEQDLKQAKKIVLQTHPDKCELDKEYFLFFTAAYKIIHSIYSFRHKGKNGGGGGGKQTTEYSDIISYEEEKEETAKSVSLKKFKEQDNKQFNKVFNELFEKYKLEDEEMNGGYGEFMRSDEGLDTRSTTMANMNETFEKKKNELKAIVPVRDIDEMYSLKQGFGANLTSDKPESYASGLFSNLQYEDLRKAHIETVIPVNQEDYLQRPKYKNVDEFMRDEKYNDVKPPSLSQSKDYLQQRELLEGKTDVSRAYKLARKEEVAKKANQGFMSEFQQLTNF